MILCKKVVVNKSFTAECLFNQNLLLSVRIESKLIGFNYQVTHLAALP